MGNTFISDIRDKAAKKFLKVAFPDAEDVRTLKAALILKDKRIADPILVGPASAIGKIAADNGLDIGGHPHRRSRDRRRQGGARQRPL